ncbi:MAG: NAD-dependent epimerase/dehydratase family protein, partial [Gemmatimonadales bacterium]|nr:NAD-dependent epimerase/dehydratase family protein [Gemmatimonadales bacterium]
MKLLVTGGTGFLGRALIPRLRAHGHGLVLLTRKPRPSPGLSDSGPASGSAAARPPPAAVGWDSGWERDLASFDGIINLAGESIAGGRWTAARKQALRDSRIGTTRRLVQALAAASPPRPSVLVNASAI